MECYGISMLRFCDSGISYDAEDSPGIDCLNERPDNVENVGTNVTTSLIQVISYVIRF